jgi:hypothetical protein
MGRRETSCIGRCISVELVATWEDACTRACMICLPSIWGVEMRACVDERTEPTDQVEA